MIAVDDGRLAAMLREDAPYGDLTTHSLGIAGTARMVFHARRAMRVAGTEEAARLVELAGGRAEVVVPSGVDAAADDCLLRAEGDAPVLLLAWKVAQNLVEALSGIATATASILTALEEAGCAVPVACTRKNFPGTRALAAKAVHAGGGVMHRLGLSETLLVFPEHRALIDATEWPRRLARLRLMQPEKRIVVEVGNADDAMAMARGGADVIQLERFPPEALAGLRVRLRAENRQVALAPAGGVTVANAVAYAKAGADLLVTSAPYFAPPADVKVIILPAG